MSWLVFSIIHVFLFSFSLAMSNKDDLYISMENIFEVMLCYSVVMLSVTICYCMNYVIMVYCAFSIAIAFLLMRRSIKLTAIAEFSITIMIVAAASL